MSTLHKNNQEENVLDSIFSIYIQFYMSKFVSFVLNINTDDALTTDQKTYSVLV